MKIYIVRHGLVPSNKLKVINGQSKDEALVSEGIEEIKEAILKIPATVSRIYSSNMLRTRQTADILNEVLQLEITYHPELREVDFGNLDGKPWDEHSEKYGKELQQSYIDQTYDFTSYNGESFENVKERVMSLLKQIKSNHSENDTVLLVAHGGIIRFLHTTFNGGPFVPAKNAEVREFNI